LIWPPSAFLAHLMRITSQLFSSIDQLLTIVSLFPYTHSLINHVPSNAASRSWGSSQCCSHRSRQCNTNLKVSRVDILENHHADAGHSQPTCDCTATVTVTTALPAVTVVAGNPYSIASSFSYASGIDSIVYQNSKEDRPTGEPPETTSIPFTHTASGPAIIATDDPNDSTDLYHLISTTMGPVATTTIWFPPADPVATESERNGDTTATSTTTDYASLDTDHDGTVTITTYLSTTTVDSLPATTSPPTNLSITARDLQKRQTCSMIFAEISGEWASWCNNWDGSTVVSYSTYETTTLITDVHGAPSVPESVWNPSHTTDSDPVVTIQTSPAEEPTSPSDPPTSPGVTSFVVTTSIVVTYPLTTITETYPPPSPTSTPGCGQIGEFVVSFDDLPRYSTNNPNDTAVPPIFAPYDHFYWSSGYGYGSPPETPYTSQGNGANRIAIYHPADETATAGPAKEGRDLPGSFGAGSRFWNSVYWFDAKSAYVGCNDTTTPCDVFVTGYRWYPDGRPDATKAEGHEVLAFTEQHTISPPACGDMSCNMTWISFDAAKFSGLSTINFQADQGGTKAGFYLDSFTATWTNSTCEAGRERQSSRK